MRERIAGRVVLFEREAEGGYHVSCPELKGCHSFGMTKEEARRNIAEAIHLWLESTRELSITLSHQEEV